MTSRIGRNDSLRFLGILLVGAFLASCKTTGPVLPRLKPDFNKKNAQLIENVQENAFLPRTLSFKAQSKLVSGDKSNSIKLNVRMRTDSVIWISVTAFSYEAARILATPDSLFFINRPEKKYFAGSYEFFHDMLQVELDFQLLQAILLGNSIGLEEVEKVRRYNEKDYYVLSSVGKHKLKRVQEKDKDIRTEDEVVYSNWVDPETFRIVKMMLLDLRNNQSVAMEFNDFEEIDGFNLAQSMKARITSTQIVEITSEYSKFVINGSLKYPFHISDKYEPMQ